MFLNPAPTASQQQGAALVVAIFIIVVMSIVAATLARVLTASSQASVDEVYGARALHAANTGTQFLLTQLYTQPDRVDRAQCRPHLLQFQAPALSNCEAAIRCAEDTYEEFSTSVFRVTSEGSCITGSRQYSRTVVIETVDEN